MATTNILKHAVAHLRVEVIQSSKEEAEKHVRNMEINQSALSSKSTKGYLCVANSSHCIH
jgi:hypothetical protein